MKRNEKINEANGERYKKSKNINFLFSRSTGNEPKMAGSEGGNDERKMEETSVYSGSWKNSLVV